MRRRSPLRVSFLLVALMLAALPSTALGMEDPGVLFVSVSEIRDGGVGPAVDAVAHDATLDNATRGWHLQLDNASTGPVTDATIEVDSGYDPGLFHQLDGEEFPFSIVSPSLDVGEQLSMPQLASSDIPAPFAPGFDSSRQVSPLQIPSGGSFQDVTVEITLVDADRFGAGTHFNVSVDARVDGTTVESSSPGADVDGTSVTWWVSDADVGTTFTFSLTWDVPNVHDVTFDHKPAVSITVWPPDETLEGTTGASTMIAVPTLDDDEPGSGKASFAVGQSDRTWIATLGHSFTIGYEGFGPGERIATRPDHVPPTFSRPVTTSFPDQPFVTCTQGQFQDADLGFDARHLGVANLVSDPHHWFLMPAADGTLQLDVSAIGWAEPGDFFGGHIVAQLFDVDSGVLLGEMAVPHVEGVFANTETMTADASAGTLLRLDIRAEWSVEPHYQLGFTLLDDAGRIPDGVTVGVNSTALPEWLEPMELQVFHVNIDDEEGLHLRLTPEPEHGHPHEDATPATVAVYADPGFEFELGQATGTAIHETFDIELASAAGSTMTVVVYGASTHYMLEKLSGSDTGIYFDACPTFEHDEPESVCVSLLAGQDIPVGDVCASDDGEHLFISYHTHDGWELIETHLAVSIDRPGTGQWIDSANAWQNPAGNPSPGRFPHTLVHDADSHERFTYLIALADISGGIEAGDRLHIAAHAFVAVEGKTSETAWADGPRLLERGNWATSFTYDAVGQ